LNKNTRWALAILGVAILIAAAVFISTSDDNTPATEQGGSTPATSEPNDEPTGPSDAPTSGGSTGGTTGGGSEPDSGTGGAKPDDNGTGGAKVSTQQGPLLVAGKVTNIKASKGDTVYLRARSKEPDHLHIHGYDYSVDLPAGKTVSYKFKADIDGAFEIEFERQGLQVAELKVSP
jgi:hypothetical protein